MGADARNGLLDAVRAARDADPGIGAKALARKLDVACKEVRDALSEISSNVTPSVAAPATKLAATAPAASAPSYGATVQPHPQGNDRNCWGCGAVAFANKFKACEKCVSEQLIPCYFCSEQCQEATWPRHKAWHKQVKANRKLREEGSSARPSQSCNESVAARKDPEQPYDQLLLEAEQLMEAGDLRKARAVLREAIHLDPNNGGAYYHLGTVLSRSGDSKGSLQAYLNSAARAREGSRLWGMAVAISFEKLLKGRGLPKPDWWHDDALRKLSAQVIVAAPEFPLSFSMRAFVLAPADVHTQLGDGWGGGDRTAAEVWKAGRYLERSAALMPQPTVSADFLKHAKRFLEASGLDESEDLEPDEELEAAAAESKSPTAASPASRLGSMARPSRRPTTPSTLVTGPDGVVRIRHPMGADGMVDPHDIPGGVDAKAKYDAPLKLLMPTQAFMEKVQQHGFAELQRLGPQAFGKKYMS